MWRTFLFHYSTKYGWYDEPFSWGDIFAHWMCLGYRVASNLHFWFPPFTKTNLTRTTIPGKLDFNLKLSLAPTSIQTNIRASIFPLLETERMERERETKMWPTSASWKHEILPQDSQPFLNIIPKINNRRIPLRLRLFRRFKKIWAQSPE